ncbi:helix-turn-helix transcriptional regulator [Pedobacter sp. B4-66]|uniref:helix-turn-helix transcriptional regulator n=1 Tax=Pedobacter sp. B4-66 TaxID=2817280 RepID=UPI001BDB5CF8|nr:helix-turn-helix transcriptional regulator [Pedobacter sp. B4-66]
MEPHLFFRYFVVAGLINIFILVLFLIKNRKINSVLFLLFSFLLLASFQAILNAFDTKAFFLSFPHMTRISWLQLSLFGPLIYLFVKKFTSVSKKMERQELIHLLPFAVYLTILAPWFLKTAGEKKILISNFQGWSTADFGYLNQFNLLMLVFYLSISLIHFKKYQKMIRETFSDLNNRKLNYIGQFLYGILLILLISALGFYGKKWNLPVIHHLYHYNYIMVVLMGYWVAYRILIQPEIFKSVEKEKYLPKEKYEKSGLTPSMRDELYQQVITKMEVQKSYLDPDLTIDTLSAQIQKSRHHVSQTINEYTGRSFYDFVNYYRIEAVKSALLDPKNTHLTIFGIALNCGFNSKATFNNAFKKFTNTTPSNFQKSKNIPFNLVG